MKIFSRQTCLLIPLVVFYFGLHAQNDSLYIDSLKKVLLIEKEDTNKVNTLNELSIVVQPVSDDSNSFQYAYKALALSEKLNFTKGKADAYYNIGGAKFNNDYFNQSIYPEVYKNYFHALQLYEALEDKEGVAQSNFSIGQLKFNEGNYPDALKNFYTALKFYEQLREKESIANVLDMIGFTQDNQGNLIEALKSYFTCLKMYEQSGDSTRIAFTYNKIGDIYLNQRGYSKALQAQFYALKMGEALNSDRLISTSNTGIGNIYEKQGESAFASGDKTTAKKKFSEALKNYLATKKFLEKVQQKDALAQLYGFLGNLYIKLHNYPSAKDNLEKSLDLSYSIKYKGQIRDTYQSLANLDSVKGNFKEAYDHYKMYIVFRDSLLNAENTKKSLEAKMQYEFDTKEAVAKEVQVKKDAEAKRIKNVQYFTITLLAIIVLAVLIIAYIQWRNNSHKQKVNTLLQQQKEKVEGTLSELKSTQAQLIQSEKMASFGELTAGIAHEIQNPLNFVNNFSEVNSELIDELKNELQAGNTAEAITIADDIKENEEKINHHGKRADAIVKGMLQHSRASTGQKESTKINALADEYLRLSYHGMRARDKNFNAEIKIDFDESIGKINIIPQDIGRVLLNLYNNAFYAVAEKKKQQSQGYGPTISLSTKRISDKVEIRVKDNGNGIPQKIIDKIFQPFFTTKPTGQGTGLGLSLSYDIIKAHAGEIKVQTKEGEGSEFIIQLPVK